MWHRIFLMKMLMRASAKLWSTIRRYIDENFDDLLNLDLKVARLLGAPAPHTLSSYAYMLEQDKERWGLFWRPVIDWFFIKLGDPPGHCYKDYKRINGHS